MRKTLVWDWWLMLATLFDPIPPGANFGAAATLGILVAGFVAAMLALFLRQVNIELKRLNATETAKVHELQSLSEREPETPKRLWDLAQATLEEYFTRNVNQVVIVFTISVTTMAAGFAVMLAGVILGFFSPHPHQAYLATAGGVVTQLIGATFIVMYRSVIAQSVQYTKTLERINAVGMAMQIMNTIPDSASEQDLKSKTKSNLIAVLVGGIVNRAE